MSAEFADLHDDLRAVARDLLGRGAGPAAPGRRCPGAAVEWRLLAETGLLGLEVPAALDGAGASFAEVAVVLAEMGRAAACSSYLGGAVLGAGTLGWVEAGPGRDALLRGIASGGPVPVAVLADGSDSSLEGRAPFRVEQSARGRQLSGRAAFVPDVLEADWLLLLANDPGGVPVIVAVEPGVAGLVRTAQPVLDSTRRLGAVTAENVQVRPESVWRFDGDPEPAIRALLDRAAVAIACDSLGLGEAIMDATVSYVRVREQFGRPVGSFQAVKHACADMLVQIRVSRQLVVAAVREVACGEAGASVAASMAKSYTCSAAVAVTGKAMQLHGGMGYTWESGIHAYLKRAALNRSLFGSPTAHRARLAARYR
jgi:alkylation response protein AidB-like acyl-CoA dehydrogenase